MTYKIIRRGIRMTAMLRVFGITALALTLLLGFRAPASARAVCTSHTEMTNLLDSRHSESKVAIGLESNGRLVEVFSTGDGSTWTIVITTPQGESCVIANGEAWYIREIVAGGPQV